MAVLRSTHNTVCGQNVELLNVKLAIHIVTTGWYIYDHWAVHIVTTGLYILV